jgi:hypothetical protein
MPVTEAKAAPSPDAIYDTTEAAVSLAPSIEVFSAAGTFDTGTGAGGEDSTTAATGLGGLV